MVINAAGSRLLSRRIQNDEAELLARQAALFLHAGLPTAPVGDLLLVARHPPAACCCTSRTRRRRGRLPGASCTTSPYGPVRGER
ncbi:hypothetical protein [Streptomyces sp. NPDC002587]